jgi:hypothetical protein
MKKNNSKVMLSIDRKFKVNFNFRFISIIIKILEFHDIYKELSTCKKVAECNAKSSELTFYLYFSNNQLIHLFILFL